MDKAIDIPDSNEGEIKWVKLDDLFSLNMAFNNTKCLEHYFETGKNDHEVYSGAVSIIDEKAVMDFNCLKSYEFVY